MTLKPGILIRKWVNSSTSGNAVAILRMSSSVITACLLQSHALSAPCFARGADKLPIHRLPTLGAASSMPATTRADARTMGTEYLIRVHLRGGPAATGDRGIAVRCGQPATGGVGRRASSPRRRSRRCPAYLPRCSSNAGGGQGRPPIAHARHGGRPQVHCMMASSTW